MWKQLGGGVGYLGFVVNFWWKETLVSFLCLSYHLIFFFLFIYSVPFISYIF